jgi:hypothetical protein
MITSRDVFGLETATNLQRAICRCSDGVPLAELWDDPNVREGFGGVLPPAVAPKTLVIMAAIRGAKTMITAAKAFECALTCDVSGLSPGDILRIPILSIDKRGAKQALSHLVGTLQSKAHLRKHLAGEPTADTVLIRHQTGRIVEVTVTAMSAQGGTLVGNWLASCIFDEAPRMAGSADGVKNLDDSLAAIQGRMRPGAQIMLVGSPNIPFGPVFELDREHFGRPSEHVVVIHGRGPLLNPIWWTPERIEKMRTSREASVQRSYVTDVLGKFADAEDQLMSSALVDAAMRKGPDQIAARPGHSYVAAIDPAMRGNAWTLVVLGCDGFNDAGEPHYYVALDKQWRGSKVQPLRPDYVLREIARDLRPYGLKDVWSDGHQIDSLRVIAEQEELDILESNTTQDEGIDGAENIRVMLESERLELSTSRTMRADLLRLRRKVNQKNTTLSMPVTADGRHCDFVPPLRLCLKYAPMAPAVTMRERDPGLAAALRAVDARKSPGNMVSGYFRSGLNG